MKKPEYVEMWATKEDTGIWFFDTNNKPTWNTNYGIFETSVGDAGTFFNGARIPQFRNLKDGQICKVGLIIWPPEEGEDGTN
jgi:hypothetical protein